MSEPKRTTPDQKRAAHAWDVVASVKVNVKDGKKRKEFGTQVKKLPTRILTSGLGPALAFLEAKKYAPDLIKALDEWMAKQRPPGDDVKRLVVRIIHGDADFLRFATAECLAYLLWLVRFAEAEELTEGAE
jgi:CRISPR-associated protein Cmr5